MARAIARTLLFSTGAASCAHMITTSDEPDDAESARAGEAARGEQQERRQGDGEVAVRPGG